MIILVSMRTADNVGYPEKRDAISHDWARFFTRHELTPILVPNALSDIGAYFTLAAAGLLLTGGDDLGPETTPSARDQTERQLLEGAFAHNLPVFGTCRGLQMINRHFGGRLSRSLPEKHVGDHNVQFRGRGIVRVNSFHNEGVLREGLAPPLIPIAVTENGVVEAIKHQELPVTAIQWHPERVNAAADLDDELVRDWLARCA